MTDELRVESIAPDRFTAAEATPIAALLCTVWPKPGRTVEMRVAKMLDEFASATTETAPRSFVVREHGETIAFAQMLPRTIHTSAGPITVAGLARVCSHPDHRGRGLGDMVVRAAFEIVDQGEFRWSLFQTSHQVQPFYERLGAVLIDNPIVDSLGDDPQANPFWDEIAMRYPASGDWPRGTLDLQGPGY